jgi:hypothetical protein
MSEFFDWVEVHPVALGYLNGFLNLLNLTFLAWVVRVVYKYSREARDYMEMAKGYSSSALQQTIDVEKSLKRAERETKAATALVTKQSELLGSIGPMRQ